MSATLVNNNVTMKVSAAVAVTGSAGTASYTCPANSYAIVQISTSSSTSGTVSIDSRQVLSYVSGLGFSTSSFAGGPHIYYLGPSQQIVCTYLTGNMYITGVCFINSP